MVHGWMVHRKVLNFKAVSRKDVCSIRNSSVQSVLCQPLGSASTPHGVQVLHDQKLGNNASNACQSEHKAVCRSFVIGQGLEGAQNFSNQRLMYVQVLHDRTVDKKVLKERAQALRILGHIFSHAASVSRGMDPNHVSFHPWSDLPDLLGVPSFPSRHGRGEEAA